MPYILNKVTHVQPALPQYRIDFFERLSKLPGLTMVVYYSPTDLGVLTREVDQISWATRLGPIKKILPGILWQSGTSRIPIREGDIVVLSGNVRFLSNIILIFRSKIRRAKVIWWGHYWSASSSSVNLAIRILIMRFADGLLFYTDQEVEEYRTRIRRQDERPVFALNNGVNLDQIKNIRLPYDANERERDLLFIGRLTKKAELGLLLTALARPCCQTITLDVIGWGDLGDSLVETARALDLDSRIRWHKASTDEDFIASVCSTCRAFVYPGEVGLSLIHTMAYGLPSIVHDDRWRQMPEYAAFQVNETGKCFQRGNSESLADTIVNLLSNSRELNRYSINAQYRIENDFNTEGMARRFSQMLEHL